MNAWHVVILVALAAAVLGALAARRAHVVSRVRFASRELDNLAAEGDGEYLA